MRPDWILTIGVFTLGILFVIINWNSSSDMKYFALTWFVFGIILMCKTNMDNTVRLSKQRSSK